EEGSDKKDYGFSHRPETYAYVLPLLAMFFDCHQQPGSAQQTAAYFQIPAIIFSPTNDRRTRRTESCFVRGQSLLGAKPLLVAPDVDCGRPGDNQAGVATSSPRGKAITKTAPKPGGRLKKVKRRSHRSEFEPGPTRARDDPEECARTAHNCMKQRRYTSQRQRDTGQAERRIKKA